MLQKHLRGALTQALGQIGFLYYAMSKSSPKGKLEIVKSELSGEVKSNDIPS